MMDIGYASIIVAIVTTVGTVIVTIIQKFRKENRDDHSKVVDALVSLKEDVKDILFVV
jgi:glycopeptide antibiotics resistance protein